MNIVRVALGERSYNVLIENGALDRANEVLAPYIRQARTLIVTDETVAKSQLPRLYAALGDILVQTIILPSGEATKSWTQLERLIDALLAAEIERADHVIALGGGVIGDLVGFACAIVKRGCHFVQIPTSLLAQVDSSVGGKTAINTSAGKNLVGAFHQPAFVLIDPSVLDSLPHRQRAAGYAEIVKYGLIADANFFDWCEANAQTLLAGDSAARTHAIRKSVETKAMIVAEDERETTGRRALLNLGHTFGHALEAETGFGAALLHGEAVAAGIGIAFRFSAHLGLCSQADAQRVTAHLKAVGLPYDAASAGVPAASGRTLMTHMMHDKKISGGTLPFILARGIGQSYLERGIDPQAAIAFLDQDSKNAPMIG